jgi:hypothetical protein
VRAENIFTIRRESSKLHQEKHLLIRDKIHEVAKETRDTLKPITIEAHKSEW